MAVIEVLVSFSACFVVHMISVNISSLTLRLELNRIFLSALTSSIASCTGKVRLNSFW